MVFYLISVSKLNIFDQKVKFKNIGFISFMFIKHDDV
jgi:hypothetical protein